jgi:hypothetical protein
MPAIPDIYSITAHNVDFVPGDYPSFPLQLPEGQYLVIAQGQIGTSSTTISQAFMGWLNGPDGVEIDEKWLVWDQHGGEVPRVEGYHVHTIVDVPVGGGTVTLCFAANLQEGDANAVLYARLSAMPVVLQS